MVYIYKHGKNRIVVSSGSEENAKYSFKDMVKLYFPDKEQEKWELETSEFYAQPSIAAKIHHMNERKTATVKARAPVKTVRIVYQKQFKFD